jgi:hypothetical protein
LSDGKLVSTSFRGRNLGRLSGRSSLADERAANFTFGRLALGHNLLVRRRLLFALHDRVHHFGLAGALALQRQRSDETLNLGRFAHLNALLVGKDAGNDVFAHVVLLGQVEQLANVVGPLGTQSTGHGIAGQSFNLLRSLLDDDQVEHGNVVADDATTDGFALAFASTTGTETLVAFFAQQTHAGIGQDALTHGKTLLVVTARNAHHVTFKLFAENVAFNFLRDTAVVQVLELALVINFDQFLEARGRARDIDLSGGVGWLRRRIRRRGLGSCILLP